MNKEDFLLRLKNILPGEKCSESKLDPPETNIYFSNIKEESLIDFHKYSLNEKLYEFFEFEPFKSFEDTNNYYQKMLKRMNIDKTHYFWFVYRKKDNKLLGTANLASINFERGSVEWGQGIDPDLWGLNYNLEIQEMLKHYIFDVLFFNRLFGQTMVTNKRAIAGVKASGCSFEGILRDFYKKDNIFIDAWMYSILSKEYYAEYEGKMVCDTKVSFNEIISLVSEIINDDNISKNTSMDNCLNWDSLSHTSIIANISDKYNIKFSPLEFTQLTSIEQIYNFLNK